MSKYLIAHDLGTSGDKASLFSTTGQLIKSHTIPYAVHYFHKNRAEQDPMDWWDAVRKATKCIVSEINAEDVLAISFSGQMSSCIIVDSNCRPLRPAMIWADQRADEQALQLEKKVGFQRIYELTGHRVSASYSLEKLMWIKDYEPELYKKTYRMLLAKDFIICKLTGKFVTDYSDASGTNALDLKNRCWSQEMLDAAGIDYNKLPELHDSTDIIANLSEKAASDLNLTTSTVVVCGGGDGPCSAVGAGCIDADQLFLSYGTSAWIGGTTKEVFLDPNKVLFCFAHVIPDHYMPCGTMQAAGSSYSYIKDTLCQSETATARQQNISEYEMMNELVEKSPVGSKGLTFLPYLLGERSPRWNPNATGSFIGIKMEHQKEDYIRAVLEGVAMNLSLILHAYENKLQINHMIFIGGGAKGDTLAQILSDVLNTSLLRPNHVENATSVAAALIAGIGIGVFHDFSEINHFLTIKDSFHPIAEHVERYQVHKNFFEEAYQCLKPLYKI